MNFIRNIDSITPCTKRLILTYSKSVAKKIDSQIIQRVLKDEEIRAKTHQISDVRPTKRRAVIVDMNELFCTIQQVHTTE